MNPLQRLIADYLADNPGETYSSIARCGHMSKSTVYSLSTKVKPSQTPHPDTVERLARGMRMSPEIVWAAAKRTVGRSQDLSGTSDQQQTLRAIVDMARELDADLLVDLHRRARSLHAEAMERRSVTSESV